MLSLSAIIVTKNEEKNIRACLESIKEIVSEIIVVDSESSDQTVAICQEYTDKVVVTPWKGCGPQKLHALNMATQEWVLVIDADERLTAELASEIKSLLPTTQATGYEIPFQSYYLGYPIQYGDWHKEKHLRLFKRKEGTIIPRLIHFRVECSGTIASLKHKILHFSYPNIETVINKMNLYSTDGAMHKRDKKQKSSIFVAIIRGLWTFIRGYIFRLGFLDGKYGFMLAFSNAEGTYYKYLKLALLR